jgi:hypothetical protein
MAEIITFEKGKIHKKQPVGSAKEMGLLVWLHCPSCKTLEYSEIISSEGRLHKCGKEVSEQEVAIDITAEYTICKRNLLHLEELENHLSKSSLKQKKVFQKLVDNLKNNELEMIKKLQKITKKNPLVAYDKKTAEALFSTAHANDMGLVISDFRFQPKARFQKTESSVEEKKDDFFKKE